MSETAAEQEAPPINEKVRFWQEQDKINQVLIPRMVKMNEVIASISSQISGLTTSIAATEARFVKNLGDEKGEREQSHLDTQNRLNSAVGETTSKIEVLKTKCEVIERQVVDLASQIRTFKPTGSGGGATWVSITALVMSSILMVLELIRIVAHGG